MKPSAYAAALFLAFSLFISVASADSFDPPLKKKVVKFEPSPYYLRGNVRVKLSCYFYPTFMVKEYDEGQKGAQWLAIVLTEKGVPPACTRSHAPEERVIEGAEWSGYFKGVKGSLVFFNDADGTNGGWPFVIYDSRTGQKIFEDSAYDSSTWTKKPAIRHSTGCGSAALKMTYNTSKNPLVGNKSERSLISKAHKCRFVVATRTQPAGPR